MKFLSLIASVFLVTGSSAFAQTLPQANIMKAVYAPVAFHDMTPEESKVLQPLFANYVASNAGMKLKTALIDLEGRGVASMVVQFISSSTCVEKSCYSSVLRFRNNRWEIAMSRAIEKMEVETTQSRKARNDETESMLIRVNGREVWQPYPDSTYHATSWGMGRPLADMKSITIPQNINVPGKSDDWYSEFIDTMLVLRSKLCDEAESCRTIIMVAGQPGTPWRTVLDVPTSGGRVAIVEETRGLMKDMLLDTALGYDTWRWNASTSKYVKTDSSYVIERNGAR